MGDLRVSKTKATIKKVFIKQVKELGYQKVTVKGLCEEAMINRNTFYLHYNDKDSLVKALMNEAFEAIKTKTNLLSGKTYLDLINHNLDELTNDTAKFLEIISQDIELYRVILLDDDLYGYFKGLEKTLEKIAIKKCNITTPSEMLIFNYILNGFTGVLVNLITKENISCNEAAKVLAKLVYVSIKESVGI